MCIKTRAPRIPIDAQAASNAQQLGNGLENLDSLEPVPFEVFLPTPLVQQPHCDQLADLQDASQIQSRSPCVANLPGAPFTPGSMKSARGSASDADATAATAARTSSAKLVR